jgi:hypothetical protein
MMMMKMRASDGIACIVARGEAGVAMVMEVTPLTPEISPTLVAVVAAVVEVEVGEGEWKTPPRKKSTTLHQQG